MIAIQLGFLSLSQTLVTWFSEPINLINQRVSLNLSSHHYWLSLAENDWNGTGPTVSRRTVEEVVKQLSASFDLCVLNPGIKPTFADLVALLTHTDFAHGLR